MIFVSAMQIHHNQHLALTLSGNLNTTMSDGPTGSPGKGGHGVCEEQLGEVKMQPDCMERGPECQKTNKQTNNLSKLGCS